MGIKDQAISSLLSNEHIYHDYVSRVITATGNQDFPFRWSGLLPLLNSSLRNALEMNDLDKVRHILDTILLLLSKIRVRDESSFFDELLTVWTMFLHHCLKTLNISRVR